MKNNDAMKEVIRSQGVYQDIPENPYEVVRLLTHSLKDGILLGYRSAYQKRQIFFIWISKKSFLIQEAWYMEGPEEKIEYLSSHRKGSDFARILRHGDFSFLSDEDMLDVQIFLSLYAKEEIVMGRKTVEDFFKNFFGEELSNLEKGRKKRKKVVSAEPVSLPSISEMTFSKEEKGFVLRTCFAGGADYLRFIDRDSKKEIYRVKISDNKIEKQRLVSLKEEHPDFLADNNLLLWEIAEVNNPDALPREVLKEIANRNPYMGLLEAADQTVYAEKKSEEFNFRNSLLFYLDCFSLNPQVEKVVKAGLWELFLLSEGESGGFGLNAFSEDFLKRILGKEDLYAFFSVSKEAIFFGKDLLSDSSGDLKQRVECHFEEILSLKETFPTLKKETAYAVLRKPFSFFRGLITRKASLKASFERVLNVSFDGLLHYLEEISEKEYVNLPSLLDLYTDYLAMISVMGRRERKHLGFKLFPKMIRYQHDKAVHYTRVMGDALTNKGISERKKAAEKIFSFENENFTLVFPEKVEDLVHESAHLGHCVKSYGSRISKGETIIAFIRKKEDMEEPFFTMEISPETKDICQLKGQGNQTPSSIEKEERTALMLFVDAFVKEKQISHVKY